MSESGTTAIGRLLRNPVVRVPLKLAATLVVLAAALFAVAAIYNAFDQGLSAEAKALLAPPQMGRIDDQNGFVAMLGMRAPLGEDQMAWGRKVAEALAAQAKPGFKFTSEWKAAIGGRLGATKDAAWCRPAERDCLALAKERAAPLASVLANEQNAEYLRRYRKVREFPVFMDIYIGTDPAAVIGHAGELVAGGNLSRLDIALKAHAGDLVGAVAELEREAAFQRRLMADGRTVLTVMIANASAANNLLLASELLRPGDERVAPYRARIRELAASAVKPGILAPAIRVEAHSNLSFFHNALRSSDSGWLNLFEKDMAPLPRWALSFLIRKNETVNIMARLTAIEIAVAEASAPEFDAKVKTREQARNTLLERPWYAELRNPVGKGAAELFGFEASSYVARLHDLDALSRMVAAQTVLSEKGVTEPAAIAAFVSGEGAKSYSEPGSGKPFAFDPATRRLSFEAKGKSQWSEGLKKRHQKTAIVL